MSLLRTFVILIAVASAMPAPPIKSPLSSRAVCEGNTASNRSVWCDYSIDTNWYDEAPDTGVTVEVGTVHRAILSESKLTILVLA